MTERKPPGVDFESWVEKQIREAQERGDFDDLPGAGAPLSGLDRDWLSTYIEREGLSLEAALPEPLRLRKEIERLPGLVAGLRDEDQVRQLARELNQRIAAWIRSWEGPRVRVAPVDVDELVAQWRERAHPATPSPSSPSSPPSDPGVSAAPAQDRDPTVQDVRPQAARRRWWSLRRPRR